MARPRGFDVDDAIQIATDLFCQRGYQATSIADLTDALQILRGSLYQVFPDKHSLLLTALDRYRIAQLDHLRRKLNQPGPAVEGLKGALEDWASQCAGSTGKRGCLITHLTQELIPADPAITERLHRHSQQLTELLAEHLDRMRLEGALSSSTPVPVLAQFVLTIMQGLRVAGKMGPPLGQVLQTVQTLLDFLTNQSSNPKARAATAG